MRVVINLKVKIYSNIQLFSAGTIVDARNGSFIFPQPKPD